MTSAIGVEKIVLRAFPWNIDAAQLIDVLVKLKADLTAVQAGRWMEQAREKISACGIYHSGHAKERKFDI